MPSFTITLLILNLSSVEISFFVKLGLLISKINLYL